MKRIRKDDDVLVITGKDKGKSGKVLKLVKDGDYALVEGLNMVKKHMKAQENIPASIKDIEAPLHISNLMLVDPNTSKPTNVGFAIVKNEKFRKSRKTQEIIK